MEKKKLIVPRGVYYLSEWNDFKLPEETCIIDKKLTGCGFTEFALRCPVPVILCSPRIKLLENKYNKHPEAFYYKDISEEQGDGLCEVDETFDISQLETRLVEYCIRCGDKSKILTTYDSFRLIKYILTKHDWLKHFYTVVDEFQAILSDGSFRGDVSYRFLDETYNIPRLCYVSATPTLDEYLEQIPQLKDLTYYELDWETDDPGRVEKAILDVQTSYSLDDQVKEIIDGYKKNGYFDAIWDNNGKIVKKSQEAVFYFNSVGDICRLIKNNGLSLSDCNVLIADTKPNRNQLKKVAFPDYSGSATKLMKEFRIPLKGEPHKTYTFCTKTVYYGADFCSTNASTYIFASGNIENLALDISEDIDQIMGRQRLPENPWSNVATLYFIGTRNPQAEDDFRKIIEKKLSGTQIGLGIYNQQNEEGKAYLASKSETPDYKNDYLFSYDGKLCVNDIVRLAEERAWKRMNVDYADRFNLLKRRNVGGKYGNPNLANFENGFDGIPDFEGRLKYLCEFKFNSQEEVNYALNLIVDLNKLNSKIAKIYEVIGPEVCSRLNYNRDKLEIAWNLKNSQEYIYGEFDKYIVEGNTYTLKELKDIIIKVYEEMDIKKCSPSAKDINLYYETKQRRIGPDNCLQILKKKDNINF